MNDLEADERGLLVNCARCGQRNRMRWEGSGRTFRCGKCQTELPPPAEAIDIANEKAFAALTRRSSLPVLVDFWAPRCGPCKMVAPEFSKVAAEGVGRWLVAKVNTEELPAIAGKYRVTSIPTMIIFQSGRETARQIGAMPATQIRQFIEQTELAGK
jgi:thioredoxin 2